MRKSTCCESKKTRIQIPELKKQAWLLVPTTPALSRKDRKIPRLHRPASLAETDIQHHTINNISALLTAAQPLSLSFCHLALEVSRGQQGAGGGAVG